MPENYEPESTNGSGVVLGDTSTSLDSAKHEASELKDTAVGQAKDVAGTVKNEASAVLGEAKYQAKDLIAQTQSELKEQANTQQQRVAAGLRSVSSELDSMSANSQNAGVATDLVRQLSGRISGAATWLGDRDPGSVLTEVKRYARRKPGTFIVAAALVGVAVGRLTRALAANASDAGSHAASGNGAVDAQWTPNGTTPAFAITDEETPLYAQSTAVRGDVLSSEGDDVRSDTF
ncbi:hypothetical protein [Microbacterium deminutum]|uniref:DUF3618 domain-containing protein n=1 Tax=Microbacterium deminutum TaxID=344164 RepID=A0ABN2QI90_9MICO